MHNKYLEKELQQAPVDPVIDAPIPVFPASVTK
jgi:hypothetical protein